MWCLDRHYKRRQELPPTSFWARAMKVLYDTELEPEECGKPFEVPLGPVTATFTRYKIVCAGPVGHPPHHMICGGEDGCGLVMMDLGILRPSDVLLPGGIQGRVHWPCYLCFKCLKLLEVRWEQPGENCPCGL